MFADRPVRHRTSRTSRCAARVMSRLSHHHRLLVVHVVGGSGSDRARIRQGSAGGKLPCVRTDLPRIFCLQMASQSAAVNSCLGEGPVSSRTRSWTRQPALDPAADTAAAPSVAGLSQDAPEATPPPVFHGLWPGSEPGAWTERYLWEWAESPGLGSECSTPALPACRPASARPRGLQL